MKHLPIIESMIIPHKSQRYDTAGDYWITKRGNWQIRISEMKPDYEFMVLIHELIEFYLTQKRGISEESITYFDTGEGAESDDPGTMKNAPYHKEHMFSTKIEKLLCKELNIDWEKYDKSFSKLKYL